MNNWQQIWQKKNADEEILRHGTYKEIVLELKRSNGFDITAEGLSFAAIQQQCSTIQYFLQQSMGNQTLTNLYEIGCGSGANLYMYEYAGLRCGGMDYSENLIHIAKSILKSEDILCTEATHIPTEPHYDCVISNSVFQYFDNIAYGQAVMEKMYQKANYTMGFFDISDADKKEEFLAFRRRLIPDYNERYKNLPRCFYTKAFFEEFAQTHEMEITFPNISLTGYWNEPYVFHCILRKKCH